MTKAGTARTETTRPGQREKGDKKWGDVKRVKRDKLTRIRTTQATNGDEKRSKTEVTRDQATVKEELDHGTECMRLY